MPRTFPEPVTRARWWWRCSTGEHFRSSATEGDVNDDMRAHDEAEHAGVLLPCTGEHDWRPNWGEGRHTSFCATCGLRRH